MNDEVERDIARLGAEDSRKAISIELLQREIGEMCRGPAQCLDASATVADAVAVMQKGRFGAVVITREGTLAGIVTERDLLMKVLGHEEDHRERSVAEIMTANPEALRVGDEAVYLINAMHVGGFRHMPIVDDNNVPLHVLSVRDVLAHVLERFSDEIKNIPTTPFRGERKRYSG